jgi:YesN/AraC family two-component response regulator
MSETAMESFNRDILKIRFTNDILQVLSKTGVGYPVDIDPNNIVIVLVVPKQGIQTGADILTGIGIDLNELLELNKDICITAGVSNQYDSLDELHYAYKDAIKALDYRIIKGSNSVILYKEVPIRSENRYYYSFIQEKQILSSLRAGDLTSIQDILRQTIVSIKNSNVSSDIAKCIYFEIVNTALKSLNELELDKSKVKLNLPNLVQIKTLDEVYQAISMFYEEICELVKKTRHTKSTSILENTIEYINNNCFNPALSVESAAEALSVSPSYLSRIFKEQSGSSFVDYVHLVRLAYAKKMLGQSDSNVALVSDAVGYNNVRNFIRVFKKYEGVTPTEYRLSQSLSKK